MVQQEVHSAWKGDRHRSYSLVLVMWKVSFSLSLPNIVKQSKRDEVICRISGTYPCSHGVHTVHSISFKPQSCKSTFRWPVQKIGMLSAAASSCASSSVAARSSQSTLQSLPSLHHTRSRFSAHRPTAFRDSGGSASSCSRSRWQGRVMCTAAANQGSDSSSSSSTGELSITSLCNQCTSVPSACIQYLSAHRTPSTQTVHTDCGAVLSTGDTLELSSVANQQALQYVALAFLHTVLAACTTLAPAWSLQHLFGFKATTVTSLQLVNAGAYLWLFASCLLCLKVSRSSASVTRQTEK
jgi:hypothetical protein